MKIELKGPLDNKIALKDAPFGTTFRYGSNPDIFLKINHEETAHANITKDTGVCVANLSRNTLRVWERSVRISPINLKVVEDVR